MQVDADSCTLEPGESGTVQLGPFEAETRLYVAATGANPGLVLVTRFEVSALARSSGGGSVLAFGDDAKHLIPAGASVLLEVSNRGALSTRVNAGLWTIAAA
jgi:hypothetical protein